MDSETLPVADDQVSEIPLRSEPIIRASKFLQTLVGTEEEIYSRLIKAQAGFRAMTLPKWQEFLENLKNAPAHRN